MKKPKKIVEHNTGKAIDITFVLAVVLSLVFFIPQVMNKRTIAALSLASWGITIVLLAVYIFFQKTKLINGSCDTVYLKPEEGGEPQELHSGKVAYDFDGVKSKGQVYKLVDGTHARIDINGEVKIDSVSGRIINRMFDGGKLEAPPDAGWQKLFDK